MDKTVELTEAMIQQNTLLKNFFEAAKLLPELMRSAETKAQTDKAIEMFEAAINKTQEGLELTKKNVVPPIKLQHIIALTDSVITCLDKEDNEVKIDKNKFEEWFGVDMGGKYEGFDDKQESIECDIIDFYLNPEMWRFDDFVAKHTENYTISC